MVDKAGNNVDLTLMRALAARKGGMPPGPGGEPPDDMEPRVAALEKGMTEIQAVLKDLRDGQHAAALEAAKQVGVLNTRLAEIDTKFAEVNGKLTGINEVGAGLRRDLDKLPSKFDVAVIMMSVIGGLVGVATLIKFALPLLAKAFG